MTDTEPMSYASKLGCLLGMVDGIEWCLERGMTELALERMQRMIDFKNKLDEEER